MRYDKYECVKKTVCVISQRFPINFQEIYFEAIVVAEILDKPV